VRRCVPIGHNLREPLYLILGTPALTYGDLSLGVLTATLTSQANMAGELSGPVKLPKSM